MIALLLLIGTVHADTWSSTVGALLSASPDVVALQVRQVEGSLVTATVAEVLRGDTALGASATAALEDVSVGDRLLRLCGHPTPDACLFGVERQGLIFLEVGTPMLHSPGHVPPGVTTTDRIPPLLAGEPASPLCVRLGAHRVEVDPATGAGTDAQGRPVGVVVHRRGGRIE